MSDPSSTPARNATESISQQPKEIPDDLKIGLSNSPTLTGDERVNSVKAVGGPFGIQPRVRDFGFIPIPKARRYHPEKEFHFTLALNVIFGFASTASEWTFSMNMLHLHDTEERLLAVSNLYYCQPLLGL